MSEKKSEALQVGGEWDETFPARREGDAEIRVKGSSIVLKSGVQIVRIRVQSKKATEGEGGVSGDPQSP